MAQRARQWAATCSSTLLAGRAPARRTLHAAQLRLPALHRRRADRQLSQLVQRGVRAQVGAQLADDAQLPDAAPLQQHTQLQAGRRGGELWGTR